VATCPTCESHFDDATFCPRDGTRLVGDVGLGVVLGDRYKLLRKVGEGAVGEVYEAEHVLIHRKVAVKVLQRRIANNRDAIARLQREAESTTGLGHPNIVDSFDFGYSDDGHVYLVMEWLDGENLDQVLSREKVDVQTALDIAAQAAAGLAEAHEHGVIHRDLKPANLFITHDRAGQLRVKVLDFGIAKLALHETRLTGTGVLIGTPNYMAPEQAFGEEVDARTDIYALGVMLYEMLTGSVPFTAETPVAVLHQHTAVAPVAPSRRAPDRRITPEVEAIVLRCLAKKPQDRYDSMPEVVAALAEAGAVVEPPRPSTSLRIARPRTVSQPPRMQAVATRTEEREPPPRRGRGALIAAIVGVAVVGGAIALIAFTRGGGAQPAEARTAPAPTDAAPPAVKPTSTTDAAVTDPGMIVAPIPTDTYAGTSKRFTYTVTVTPSLPTADQPFELDIELAGMDAELRGAAAAGTLAAKLELAYFKDHVQVHESTHLVGADGHIHVVLSVPRVAKHHAHLDLLIGGREVEHVHFDLFPSLMPR
jgi:serine/threonine-protein kinase